MGLDIYLNDDAGEEIYWANITHNLTKMADEAGIYKALWRPDENGMLKASDLIASLTDGLALLVAEPSRFEKFNASNGWGTYEDFVPFVAKYLEACKNNPNAEVRVSR